MTLYRDRPTQVTEQPPDAKLLPSHWAARQGIVLMDPDGWRADNKSLDEPITEEEFNERAALSTLRFPARGVR